MHELRAEKEKKRRGGRRKCKQTDASNEETLLCFASTHKLSEVIRRDEWMIKGRGTDERKGEKELTRSTRHGPSEKEKPGSKGPKRRRRN